MILSNGSGYLQEVQLSCTQTSLSACVQCTYDTTPSVISTSNRMEFPSASFGASIVNVWSIFESMVKTDASAKNRPGHILRMIP